MADENKEVRDQYDFLHPAILANPYPLYHRLRSEDPVHWSDFWGGWVLTRYADVVAALRNPLLSSDRTTLIMTQLPEAVRAEMGPLFKSMSMMMSITDPPDHTRAHSVFKRGLNTRVFEGMRPHIQEIVDKLLDAVQDGGQMDVIRDLAYSLPATVIAEMLGVPPEDRVQFKKWSNDITALLGTGRAMPDTARRAQRSLLELFDYFRGIVAQQRKDPKGDLMSIFIAAEEQGEFRSEEELFTNCSFLLSGGHETTSSLIGNGVLALLQNPDQLQKLKDHPSLIATAIEEFLRYDSSLQRAVRVAKEDLEIGGKLIGKGQLVVAMLGAANRDPEQWPEPDQLDITRTDNRHIAFGYGMHFCLGAPLARIEGEISITTLLRRMPALRLASGVLEWHENAAFRQLKALPVVF